MHPQRDPLPHPHPPQSVSFESKVSSKRSFREYVPRCRRWLCAIAILLALVMCLGIILVAHHYYVSFGGQGYLKFRNLEAALRHDGRQTYLPMRKVHVASGEDVGSTRRSAMEVQYYACGDQQSSCEAYNRPVSHCCLHISEVIEADKR